MPERAAIYLDSNAGAPLRIEVREALRTFLSQGDFANPSSQHRFGQRTRARVSRARESVARSLGAEPGNLTFTSSGTEANQMVIRSILERAAAATARWITTPVEHDSVLRMQSWFVERGGQVDLLPVDGAGRWSVEALRELWTPKTALASLIWVNNETGVISDVQAAAKFIRSRNGLLHIDATQAWGKLTVDLAGVGAHWASFSGHKIGALPGIGVCWSAPDAPALASLIRGHQEGSHRGGTENVLGVISLEAAVQTLSDSARQDVASMRDLLEKDMAELIPGLRVTGLGVDRVCNTSHVFIPGVSGRDVVAAMDLKGFAISAGSACASGIEEPSHVAMALAPAGVDARSAVRISLHAELSMEDVSRFVRELAGAVERLRREKGHSDAAAS